jgi:hypothetical protein
MGNLLIPITAPRNQIGLQVRDLGVTLYGRRIHVRLQLTCGRDTTRGGRGNFGLDQLFYRDHGFASPDDPKVAVCLRPGTEIAFENDVQTHGMMFRKKNIDDRLARFRQIDLNKPHQHHDALEFSNGTIVLVTDLAAGQRATVLQLPASPIEEKPQASQPAARYETA